MFTWSAHHRRRNDGEKLLSNNLTVTSVSLLTAPSTPESAREEANARAEAGEGFAWKIEGGLVYVERTPSAAQRRHLDKRGQDSAPPY